MTRFDHCLLCDSTLSDIIDSQPFLFRGQLFSYRLCSVCNTSSLSPLPSKLLLESLYNNSSYHSTFYQFSDLNSYVDSVKYILPFLSSSSVILDYGCGSGHFALASSHFDLTVFSTDYNMPSLSASSSHLKCIPISQIFTSRYFSSFDVIHLGDVLEHLESPVDLIQNILPLLKPNGILFVEGPLERNPSICYLIQIIISNFALIVRPSPASGVPYHLFRTDYKSQISFFDSFRSLSLLDATIYDDGWPYSKGSPLKKLLACLSISFSRLFKRYHMGNRFSVLYRYNPG